MPWKRCVFRGLLFSALLLMAKTGSAQSDYSQDLTIAQEHFRHHDFAKALPLLEGVLKAIDAGQLPESEYLGRCLTPLVDIYYQTDRYQDALPLAARQLKFLATQEQDRFVRRRRLEYQFRLGNILAGLGRRDEARAAWREALRPTDDHDEVTETLRLEITYRLADSDPAPGTRIPELTRLARSARKFRQQLQTVDRNVESTALLARAAKVEALAFAALGAPREAATTYRELLPRLEQPLHLDYLSTLVQLAVWEREAGEWESSEERLTAALRQRRFADQPFAQVQILEQLGLTLKAAGKPREAEKCWRLLLDGEAKLAREDVSSVALQRASLDRVRTAHEELREYPRAIQAAERYLELLAQLPNPTLDQRRRAIDILGALCVATGDYRRAEKLLGESLELTRRDVSAPADALPKTQTNLANLYRKLARTAEAEALFREVMAESRKATRPGDLQLAEAQSNVAAILTERGRFADAIALLREALAGAEQAGERGAALRASLRQFLAINYLSQGQLDRAAEELRAAIDIEGGSATGNTEVTKRAIERYIALARVELARRQRGDAAAACEQALALAEDAALQGDAVQATLRRLAGEIALDSGDPTAAEKYWLAALDAEQARGADADAARTLADLGDLAVRRKRFEEAEQYYRRALDQQADVYNLPILHYNILGNLGQVVYYWKEDHQAGLELLKQAAELLEIPRAATMGGGERERARFLARHATVFDLLVDNSLAAGNVADAFHYAERARNRTFLDQLQLAGVDLRETLPANVAGGLKQRERDLAARLAASRAAAATAARANPESDDAKRLAGEVRDLQAEFAQVWGEIRDASPFYREVLQQRLRLGALADVQREAIPADALMLFYILGDFQSHLLVIGHEPNDVTAFDLALPEALRSEFKVDSAELTRSIAVRLVDEYLVALRNVEGGRGLAGVVRSPRGFMAAERGQAVTEIFLPAAVRKLIAQRAPEHVIVVPDGPLHELPLECLVISPGERPVFALDTLPPLTYAPSATILQSLASRAPSAHPAELPSLLSVGNPRYDVEESAQASSLQVAAARDAFVDLGGRLSPLPGTREECRRASAAFGGDHSLLLLGDEATEPAVRRGLAGRGYLHLAAHGLVDERDDNLFGAIALTPPKQFTADDDGFLALHEIYALDLGDCELAALSACQTNVGGERPLEAGSTLARAFLAAGARRVVSSQWNVDDAAGGELIALLWEEIAAAEKAGGPVHYAKALRDAQRRIRQRPEYASAYYWAPFVLIGPANRH